MAKKRTNRSKASPKSGGKTAKSSPDASEEFGGNVYGTDDWKSLKRMNPGGFSATIVDLEKKSWDDGPSWYAELEGHDKLAKIGIPSGKSLAAVFGNDMETWKGRKVHVMPHNYGAIGWGAVIDPIEDEDDTDDDVSIDQDDEDLD